jgi:hypothetical protein
MIKRETTASLSVLSVASYISMSLLLNEPQVPAFVMGQMVLDWITSTSSAAAAAATGTAVSEL